MWYAEDLGIIDDATRKLLADSGLPGMRVMQFGFEDGDSAQRAAALEQLLDKRLGRLTAVAAVAPAESVATDISQHVVERIGVKPLRRR